MNITRRKLPSSLSKWRLTVAAILFFSGLETWLLRAIVAVPGQHWYSAILVLPWVLASAVSGNVHQPSVIVLWLCAFLLIALLNAILYWAVRSFVGWQKRAHSLDSGDR